MSDLGGAAVVALAVGGAYALIGTGSAYLGQKLKDRKIAKWEKDHSHLSEAEREVARTNLLALEKSNGWKRLAIMFGVFVACLIVIRLLWG